MSHPHAPDPAKAPAPIANDTAPAPVADRFDRDAPPRQGAVIGYLNQHPVFLDYNLEFLVDACGGVRPRPGGAVDLQSYLIDRLRDRLARMTKQQRALLATSRANISTQARVQSAILFVVEAAGMEELLQAISIDVPVILGLDASSVVVACEDEPCRASLPRGFHTVRPALFRRMMPDGETVALSGDIRGRKDLFGDIAPEIRSQALVRLTILPDGPDCLLALGSRDPAMYQADMPTDLVSFLAQVIERCLRHRLLEA